MNTPYQLDEYDFKLIKLFKSKYQTPITLDKIKEIWAERCGLDIEYVSEKDISEHLLELARTINLFGNEYIFQEFIFDLQPSANWKYLTTNRLYLEKDTTDFNLILLSRLDCLFSNTRKDKLPGYENFIEKSVDKAV